MRPTEGRLPRNGRRPRARLIAGRGGRGYQRRLDAERLLRHAPQVLERAAEIAADQEADEEAGCRLLGPRVAFEADGEARAAIAVLEEPGALAGRDDRH